MFTWSIRALLSSSSIYIAHIQELDAYGILPEDKCK